MGKNKDRYPQGMSATPPMGEVECPPSRHQGPCRSARLAEELGGLRRDPEHHLGSRQPVFGVACGVPRKSLSPPSPMGASGPSLGPAIHPSSDIECPVRTFPMASFSFPDHRLLGVCWPYVFYSSCLSGLPRTPLRRSSRNQPSTSFLVNKAAALSGYRTNH